MSKISTRPVIAALGAVAAALMGLATVLVVRGPLSRVPENTMKFAVGTMLTSFGTFWGAEGAGVQWPGGDGALAVIIPSTFLFAVGMVAILRRLTRAPAAPRVSAA